MEYLKKVLVTKQVSEGFSLSGKNISGIVRLEVENCVATLYLSLINVATVESGCYYVFLQDANGVLYSFDIGRRPTSFSTTLLSVPSIERGFSAGVVYIKDDLPILITFACSDTLKINISDFKKIIAEKCLSDRKSAKKMDDLKEIYPLSQKYDDEVVATENYYLKDAEIEEKLKIIELMEYGNVRDEVNVSFGESKEEKREEENSFFNLQDETNDSPCEKFSEQNPYYLTAKEELDKIFENFPPEETLMKTLPFSKWAKINYAEDKFYVVGLVKENKKEKYICYGIPAKYSPEPPKELAGYCSFIPLSIFDMKGDGYWMMFQDAVTGECAKLNKD